jgi:hypothetical protein
MVQLGRAQVVDSAWRIASVVLRSALVRASFSLCSWGCLSCLRVALLHLLLLLLFVIL